MSELLDFYCSALNCVICVTWRRNLLAIRLSGETSDCLHEKQTCSSESRRAVLIPDNKTIRQSWNFLFPPLLLIKLPQMGVKACFFHLSDSYSIGCRADSYGTAELAACAIGLDLKDSWAEKVILTQNKRRSNEPKDLHSSQ